ncbi:MAG: preprotein translocase subunit SecA [Desulfobacterales bacterium]|jgi:preprotein translocase subunit SecA|nr:preprotein translocase subunit SecA [Desulfobacteraceae bacterium]MDD3990542.1 preprotein translocase subunit SecA [Desulfobacteraceae bacterium]MDY0311929.1 preprotein translocase subunit SecA [Desulfobacterales bacterium]
MWMNWLTRVFGTKNDRLLKQIQPLVEQINQLEPQITQLDDAALKARTASFRQRVDNGEPLEDLLPEAFATVREASRRTLNMRHFDVQLIGGVVLHRGMIAEMKTGEGKTLVATLPCYLNALTGRGVHVVTVNDYLARRDTEWMGQIYRFLGLSVGSILHGLDDRERQASYGCDITYGTNNEFGFDYLRDNMKFERQSLVQRHLHYAIVDEVDSILIDEARTPLIISGPAELSTDMYYQANRIIPQLRREQHYVIDEKARSATLTEEGVARAEALLGVENLYDPSSIEILHHVHQALKAHSLFKRDVDYIVKDGEVIIVDEFTGRLMPGRRYSDGLHQALEAKENVKIENENQTLATITFQNYFRMYDKLAGMTGTADTEAAEFKKIYELEVAVIPTNKPMIRTDFPDVIYKTRREKFNAVIEEITELHRKGQPVLVGTVSIDVSEMVADQLKKRGIPHTILNAKNHEKEAEIIAMAGQRGGVTISTNMAGRGTDIVLGPGVVELGGLHIIGTERHESRRIDNQLRGRSGRQGDPGSSRFYLALEDDLLRIFGGERITGIMERLGMEEGEPIEHNLISRAIENAQSKVEAHNFEIRKQLLEYDDVMNQQREVIYRQRHEILEGENLRPAIEEMIQEAAGRIADDHVDQRAPAAEWDFTAIDEAVYTQFAFHLTPLEEAVLDNLTREGLSQLIYQEALDRYHEKETRFGTEAFRQLERFVMLQTVDARWKDHLLTMDHLKEGIGLRGYAQQNPLMIYKKEGFEAFQDMIERISEETLRILFRVELAEPEQTVAMHRPKPQEMQFSGGGEAPRRQPTQRKNAKVGRNDPCPCGSGKKYKKCCGR